ncbi:hypothetical protein LTR37_009428 [Vermiconidia calcicola]|uniref:Uncharacterized protein n=1 Tax=Vermiconidia calcicola TaxID=1690605 RepID=A0ACC3NAG6_9PEZI|nr:hypothetical protein LTR37_009428 [Vermiconidia calcicola]
MKLSIVLCLPMLGVAPSLAIPTPVVEEPASAEPGLLFERQSAARTCGGHTYNKQDQTDAFNQAKNKEPKGIKAKNGRVYPEEFRNTPENLKFPDCPGASAPFREFPILRDGTLFMAGDDQDKDRIAYKDTGSGYNYCGVMTYQGAPPGRFILCN